MIAFRFLMAMAGAALLAAAPGAFAQSYPVKPVRLVVPFAPGGSNSVLARILAQYLGEIWGQNILVDNRPGAGGNIGAEVVAASAPDGYTYLLSTQSIAVNVSLAPSALFDPVKSFDPVILAVDVKSVLIVPSTLPVESMKELIAYAKARPGKLDFASTGNGTTGHLAMELFKSITGTQVQHIPYKVISQAFTDIIDGRISLWITTLASALPHIKNGRIRALAVSGDTRSGSLPAVPTFAQAGTPTFVASTWAALFAPSGTPREAVSRVNVDVNQILKKPDALEKMAAVGFDPIGGPPEKLRDYLGEEIRRWSEVVKNARITAN